ncbi:MAG: class I SAM-dependent methyltransferase [Ferruginibacter sp.]
MRKSSSESKDPLGLQTLQLFASVPEFNKWLFQSVSPFCSGNILETGSGIGNISQCLLSHFEKISLSDLREEYCEILKQKFGAYQNLQGIYSIDLSSPDFEKSYSRLINKFDTVIALNVIEHIYDDSLAIINCKKLLTRQGQLIILVPAYQNLYNSLDNMLKHYRRYNKNRLENLLQGQGMNLIHARYFNFAGIFGWWFTGNVLKSKVIPGYLLKIFNKLIPLSRILDRLIFYRSGLSVIVIAQNNN